MANKKDLKSAAAQILREAKEKGVSTSYFFTTTFEDYKYQLSILERVKKQIDAEEVLIEKEYVKGRVNVVANPAIGEFNKTRTAANGTVSTLINIVKQLSEEKKTESKLDLIEKMIRDGDNGDDLK